MVIKLESKFNRFINLLAEINLEMAIFINIVFLKNT